MRIILDCDDVLFDCNKTAIERLNQEYGYHYKKEDIRTWNPEGKEFDQRYQYFHDPRFIRNLPLVPGAKAFVQAMRRSAEIILATSVYPECASARMEAIEEYFPEIPERNVMVGGRKDLLTADYILDDCPHHVRNAKYVRYPVLMRQPWNQEVRDVTSVNSLEEFLELFQTFSTLEKRIFWIPITKTN